MNHVRTNTTVTQKDRILLAVLDLAEDASTKKIAKELRLKPDSVAVTLWGLKKQGDIESAGYGRYQLTNEGRRLVGAIMSFVDESPDKDLEFNQMKRTSPRFEAMEPRSLYGLDPIDPVPIPTRPEVKPEEVESKLQEVGEQEESEIGRLNKQLKYWHDAYTELAKTIATNRHAA